MKNIDDYIEIFLDYIQYFVLDFIFYLDVLIKQENFNIKQVYLEIFFFYFDIVEEVLDWKENIIGLKLF